MVTLYPTVQLALTNNKIHKFNQTVEFFSLTLPLEKSASANRDTVVLVCANTVVLFF